MSRVVELLKFDYLSKTEKSGKLFYTGRLNYEHKNLSNNEIVRAIMIQDSLDYGLIDFKGLGLRFEAVFDTSIPYEEGLQFV